MTHEVRVDPLSGHRTVVAAARADRPGALPEVGPPPAIDPATDPFAPGNEDQTPPEVLAVGREPGAPADSPGWRIRAFPNRWPTVVPDAPEP
jgi:UDPglucose--hexose-1-phosphate uridylyltransferase